MNFATEVGTYPKFGRQCFYRGNLLNQYLYTHDAGWHLGGWRRHSADAMHNAKEDEPFQNPRSPPTQQKEMVWHHGFDSVLRDVPHDWEHAHDVLFFLEGSRAALSEQCIRLMSGDSSKQWFWNGIGLSCAPSTIPLADIGDMRRLRPMVFLYPGVALVTVCLALALCAFRISTCRICRTVSRKRLQRG